MDDADVAAAAARPMPLLEVLKALCEGLREDHPQALAAAFIALMQACGYNSQRMYLGLLSEAGMFELLQSVEFSEGLKSRVVFKGARLVQQAARASAESPAAFLRALIGMQEAEMVDAAEADTMAALCGVLATWGGFGDAAAQGAVAKEALIRLLGTLDTYKQLGKLLVAFLECPANPYPAGVQNDILRAVLRNPDVADLGGEGKDLLAVLPGELQAEARGWLAEAVEDDSSADEDGNLRDFVCDDEEVDYEDESDALGDTSGGVGNASWDVTQDSEMPRRKRGKAAAAAVKGGKKAVMKKAAAKKTAAKPVARAGGAGRLRRAAASPSSSSGSDSDSSASSSSSSTSNDSNSDDADSSSSASDSSGGGAGRKRQRSVPKLAITGAAAKKGSAGAKGRGPAGGGKRARALSSSDDEDNSVSLLSSSSDSTESWPSDSDGDEPPRKRAKLAVTSQQRGQQQQLPPPPLRGHPASSPFEASIIELIGDSQASSGVGGAASGGRRGAVVLMGTPSPLAPAVPAARGGGASGALPPFLTKPLSQPQAVTLKAASL